MTKIGNDERMILEKDLEELRRQKAVTQYYLAKGALAPAIERTLTERIPHLDSAIERLTTRLASGRLREGILIAGLLETPQVPDRIHNQARDREFTLR